MVFRSKMDSWFKRFFAILFFLVTAGMWIAPIFDSSLSGLDWFYLTVIYVLMIVFLCWIFLDTKYEFKQQYLVVKGGPIGSKIKYSDITKVARATDLYTGYRLATSKNVLEIFYTTAVAGSVKISPYQQEAFVEELLKRCPHIENTLI